MQLSLSCPNSNFDSHFQTLFSNSLLLNLGHTYTGEAMEIIGEATADQEPKTLSLAVVAEIGYNISY